MPPDAIPVPREEIERFEREKGVTKVARGVSGLVDENGNWIGGSFYARRWGRPRKAPPPAPRPDPAPEHVPASRAHAEQFAAAIEATRKATPKKPAAARVSPPSKPAPDEARRKADPRVDKCACGRWKTKRGRTCNHCRARGSNPKTGPTEQTRAYAEKIREMVDAEWKTSAISEALGISQSRVYQIANAFSIDTNRTALGQKPDDAKRQRYRDLHGRGLTSKEIAAELGVSKRAVRSMLAKLDLTPNEPVGQAPFVRAAPDPAKIEISAPVPEPTRGIPPETVADALRALDRAPASVALSGAVIRAVGILRQALEEAQP